MSEPAQHPIKCLVVDAFGTIAYLQAATRPYSSLRSLLALHGANVVDFPVVAMTRPLGLAGLAEHYGVELPMTRLRALEDDLFRELQSLRLSPGAAEALHVFLDRGVEVVVGSNLSLPYGVALSKSLEGAGLFPRALQQGGAVRRAFSYELGSLKPQPAFYDAIASAVKLPGAAILMVGDKEREDRAGPLQAGWQCLEAKNRTADEGCWRQLARLARAVQA